MRWSIIAPLLILLIALSTGCGDTNAPSPQPDQQLKQEAETSKAPGDHNGTGNTSQPEETTASEGRAKLIKSIYDSEEECLQNVDTDEKKQQCRTAF